MVFKFAGTVALKCAHRPIIKAQSFAHCLVYCKMPKCSILKPDYETFEHKFN